VTNEVGMLLALEDAMRGTGQVSPNPRVGSVIVRDNEVVARGWHRKFGGVHAEVDALRQFTGPADGCTMFVTLEPCCHKDKQPPCVDAIIASGIPNVVVGMVDPYERVKGRGLQRLRDAGLNVVVGVRELECAWINRWFSHHVTTGLSYVLCKMATTLDLRASDPQSTERWITGLESRAVTHGLRGELDAVMIGIGTAVSDDPLLNVRLVEGRNPIRCVVDTKCRLPCTSQLVSTADIIRTIIFCSNDSSVIERRKQLADVGCELYPLDVHQGRLDPRQIIAATGSLGIASILLEGGPQLSKSFLEQGCVNELVMHVAPSIAGSGPTWLQDLKPVHFDLRSVRHVGRDAHLTYTKGSF